MNRIRELRKQKGLTQKELAKQLLIADSTLSYWEMGKYEPDCKALRELSEFFLVPIDYILGGDITIWETDRVRRILANTAKPSRTGTDSSANENEVKYRVITQHDHNSSPSDFCRSEFKGLSPDEVDKIAQYAVFIKSQRGNF